MAHIYMEYYSAIKRNETELFVVRWMNLEGIMLSELRQRRQILYDITCMWNLKKKKMVLMNLGAGQEQRCRYREWT